MIRLLAAVLAAVMALGAPAEAQKISELPASTLPLSGPELTPLVQGGTTKRATIADIMANIGAATLTNKTINCADNICTMAPIPSSRVLGNVSGVAAAPVALTPTQLTTLVDPFTTSLKGAAPASGGGSVKFLRADATWAEPPGGGLSPLQYGAVCDGATDDSSAFVSWFAAVLSTGKPGILPAATCKINSALFWNLTTAATTGVTISGAGIQRSILDVTAVASSPAFTIGGDSGANLFYGAFRDFGVRCNIAGNCLQFGRQDFADPMNVFDVNLWVGNNSASASAVAVEFNHYLNSPKTALVANTGGGGTALKLRQALFNNFYGSFSTASKGIHYATGYSYGNNFHAVDIENIVGGAAGGPVVSDIVTASKQTFLGGTFVWNNSSATGGAARINDGSNNFRFIGTQFSRDDAGSIYPLAIGTKAAVVQIDTDIEGTYSFAAANVAPRAADAYFVALIPDTFTGGLTIRKKDDITNPARWTIATTNTGSPLNFGRFDAAGVAVDNPLSLDWATGVATFINDVRIVNPANAAIATFSNEAGGSYQINLPSVGASPRTMMFLEDAANPSATIGTSAVNGVATTYMRSDAAPAVPAAAVGTAGIAKLHNIPVAVGWPATLNPNNIVMFAVDQASTITKIKGSLETAVGAAATVSVFKAPSGTACSAGSVLHSGSFDANGTPATDQTLTLTVTTVAAGDRVCLQTTGGANWTTGVGIGTITIFLAPTA